MCDLGREHGGFRVAGTEPVQRPGGEELREVRAGVEVWEAGWAFALRVMESHCGVSDRTGSRP